MNRPEQAAGLETPDRDDALAMAGTLFHYIAGSEELRTRLARWMEHHEGDLDEQTVLWYLTECHKVLEPGCTLPIDSDVHPGRTR